MCSLFRDVRWYWDPYALGLTCLPHHVQVWKNTQAFANLKAKPQPELVHSVCTNIRLIIGLVKYPYLFFLIFIFLQDGITEHGKEELAKSEQFRTPHIFFYDGQNIQRNLKFDKRKNSILSFFKFFDSI